MESLSHKSTKQLEEEKELILNAQKNIDYFEPLFNQYFETIFRFIAHRVENMDDTADLTSQVFLQAISHLHKYQFMNLPFSAWLFRIAINEIKKYYRQSKRQRTVNIDIRQIEGLAEETETDDSEDRIKYILEALKELKEKELIIIEMRFFEGRPFKEIADILNITENNAKTKVYRIIDKIKLQIF